jgi:hypothetical protein
MRSSSPKTVVPKTYKEQPVGETHLRPRAAQ